MSKLQVKIDEELWERGKIIIHGDTEGKTTVDIEAMKKGIEKYLTEYAEKLGVEL